MIYAVATADACFVYDTEQAAPFAMFANLHLAPLTDVTWYDGE
jgi:chromatin assembly factor 1 subunit B